MAKYHRYGKTHHRVTLPDEFSDVATVERYIDEILKFVRDMGFSGSGKQGVALLKSLSGDPLVTGPYSGYSLIDATNMTLRNLLILRGLVWMLENDRLPFTKYKVTYDDVGVSDYHVRARKGGVSLGCQVAYVYPVNAYEAICALFTLIRAGRGATICAVVVNRDGLDEETTSKIEKFMQRDEILVCVDIENRKSFALKSA